MTEAKRLRALQRENAELKRLVGDPTLDNWMLKDILEKSGKPPRRCLEQPDSSLRCSK
ncbi:MAG TPA: hypothetical protein VFM05_11200 [Candidatus Saccharimonadales bacterium]|nr:hypothetical protein [Candidatus Saccharimonadales bacterium]